MVLTLEKCSDKSALRPRHLSEARIALYFGDGGTYDASGLDDRASMLSDVCEVVSLLNHDLQLLAMEAAKR